jgi:hypothetical protein
MCPKMLNVMKTCEKFDACGFVTKYGSSNHIDCRGFVNSFCKGSKMQDCARLAFFKKHNCAPPDDMLPSGKIMDCTETIEPYGKSNPTFY